MHSTEEFYNFYQQNFTNSNSELYQELNIHRKKAFKFLTMGAVGIFLVIIGWISFSVFDVDFDRLSGFLQTIIIGGNMLFIIGLLIILGIGGSAANKFKAIFKDRVIRKIIDYIDPSLKYYPDNFIGRGIFELAGFFPSSRIDKYQGDDLVEGVIGKTKIKFSELLVQEERKSDKNTYYVDIFKGLFIVVDFNKNFKGRTYVMPDINDKTYSKFFFFGEKQKTHFGELVKLENPEFEKICAVFSTDQIEARYILSTSLMDRIVKFRNRVRREVFFCFANSQIYIAIPFRMNLFEPKITKKTIEFSLLQAYYEVLLDTISIVEELNLNTRIWTKE